MKDLKYKYLKTLTTNKYVVERALVRDLGQGHESTCRENERGLVERDCLERQILSLILHQIFYIDSLIRFARNTYRISPIRPEYPPWSNTSLLQHDWSTAPAGQVTCGLSVDHDMSIGSTGSCMLRYWPGLVTRRGCGGDSLRRIGIKERHGLGRMKPKTNSDR